MIFLLYKRPSRALYFHALADTWPLQPSDTWQPDSLSCGERNRYDDVMHYLCYISWWLAHTLQCLSQFATSSLVLNNREELQRTRSNYISLSSDVTSTLFFTLMPDKKPECKNIQCSNAKRLVWFLHGEAESSCRRRGHRSNIRTFHLHVCLRMPLLFILPLMEMQVHLPSLGIAVIYF